MDFIPRRRSGLLIGGGLFLLFSAIALFGILTLGRQQISLAVVLWVGLPLVFGPLALLVAYRLYALFTVHYRLDRDGFFMIWGLAREQIPISAIEQVLYGSSVGARLNPGFGLWWPGCIAGRRRVAGIGMVEFFSTGGPNEMVVIDLGERALAISPVDLEAFESTLMDATRMGSLEPIPLISRRPDFVLSRVWGDRAGRVLVLLGLFISMALLGYLGFTAPRLPAEIAFGFDALGQPSALVPPGRLLLLPMIGGMTWLADLFLGAFLFRRENDRPLAYLTWGMSILVGVLLWIGTLLMISIP